MLLVIIGEQWLQRINISIYKHARFYTLKILKLLLRSKRCKQTVRLNINKDMISLMLKLLHYLVEFQMEFKNIILFYKAFIMT